MSAGTIVLTVGYVAIAGIAWKMMRNLREQRLKRPIRLALFTEGYDQRVMDKLVGKRVVCRKGIVGGIGVVEIHGAVWRVYGVDCKPMTLVRVEEYEGTALLVTSCC